MLPRETKNTAEQCEETARNFYDNVGKKKEEFVQKHGDPCKYLVGRAAYLAGGIATGANFLWHKATDNCFQNRFFKSASEHGKELLDKATEKCRKEPSMGKKLV